MQNIDETEDGEISDDSGNDIEPYTALERPSSLAPAHQSFNNKIVDDTDESSESSISSDDSSSQECQRPAKRRKKLRKPGQSGPSSGKHNVWSAVVFEDHIEQELKEINVHRGKNHLTRTRDVESYDYSLCLMSRLEEEDLDYETEKKIRKKLAELDKNDGSESLVKKDLEVPEVPEDFEQSLQQTQQLLVNSRKRKMDQRDQVPVRKTVKSRLLRRVEDLDVTEESSPMEVAQDITVKLHEEKMDLILRVVEILGKEIAIQLFHETQETENDEGILVADGSRRRTPGGVFLYLLRNHDVIPMEKIREVFSEETKAKEKFKKTLRAKRRQNQAEKLKQTLLEDGKLPPLPTRAEIELRSGINRQQDTDQSRLSESIPGTSSALEDVDPDEDIVDIHFDCE